MPQRLGGHRRAEVRQAHGGVPIVWPNRAGGARGAEAMSWRSNGLVS